MMKSAGLALAIALAACGSRAVKATGGAWWPPPPAGASLADKVVWDFERATLAGQDAFASLFDFAEVGAYEILLHRYDALGRAPELSPARRDALLAEQPEPYPEARERRNVARYYPRWVKRTVGTGGCAAGPAKRPYVEQLTTFEPLPAEHAHYEPLRARVNAQLAGGGIVVVRCTGGKGGLALIYSPRDHARGYDLITIYDDGPE